MTKSPSLSFSGRMAARWSQKHLLESNDQRPSFDDPASPPIFDTIADREVWEWLDGNSLGWNTSMVSVPLLNHDAVRAIVDRHRQDRPHAALWIADGSVVKPPVTVFISAFK